MKTIPQLFLEQAASKPDVASLFLKEAGQFRALAWREVHADVRRFVTNLVRLGVEVGDRVVQYRRIATSGFLQILRSIC